MRVSAARTRAGKGGYGYWDSLSIYGRGGYGTAALTRSAPNLFRETLIPHLTNGQLALLEESYFDSKVIETPPRKSQGGDVKPSN
jgi:hypothetical protein